MVGSVWATGTEGAVGLNQAELRNLGSFPAYSSCHRVLSHMEITVKSVLNWHNNSRIQLQCFFSIWIIFIIDTKAARDNRSLEFITRLFPKEQESFWGQMKSWGHVPTCTIAKGLQEASHSRFYLWCLWHTRLKHWRESCFWGEGRAWIVLSAPRYRQVNMHSQHILQLFLRRTSEEG